MPTLEALRIAPSSNWVLLLLENIESEIEVMLESKI